MLILMDGGDEERELGCRENGELWGSPALSTPKLFSFIFILQDLAHKPSFIDFKCEHIDLAIP